MIELKRCPFCGREAELLKLNLTVNSMLDVVTVVVL